MIQSQEHGIMNLSAFTMTDLERFSAEWHDDSPVIKAHTSGSTGRPKEIRLSKRDMLLSAKATCEFFGIDSGSWLLCPLAFDYIAAKMMYVRSQVAHAHLVCEVPSSTPVATWPESMPPGEPIALMPIVPLQLEGLMKSPHISNVRNVVIGGAPLSHSQIESLTSAPFRAFATYGMTETSSHVALQEIGVDNCFSALPGFSFSIDNEGCLIIRNPMMSWKQIVTTDLVELSDSHHFRWLGRRDNVINSGGVKVMPEPVEERVRELLPGVEFCVTSRGSSKLGREVVIVVNPSAALPMSEADLLAELKLTLPRYHAPRALLRIQLERTPSGKMIRPKLP